MRKAFHDAVFHGLCSVFHHVITPVCRSSASDWHKNREEKKTAPEGAIRLPINPYQSEPGRNG